MLQRARFGVHGAMAAAAFAASLAFTLSTFTITNDDYLHLTTAQQLLVGELPVRDFIDPGEPLFSVTSAAVQRLFDAGMLGEVLLDATALALGHAVVLLLVHRATGSMTMAVLATAFAVLLAPRLYAYPKIALYAVAVAAIWYYAGRPRLRALTGVAALTACAFLFRHDHGAFIGIGMATMLVVRHAREGWRVPLRRVLLFGATTALFLLPFLTYVQLNLGLVAYWRNTSATGRAEYARTVGPYPVLAIDHLGIVPVPRFARPHVRVRWAPDVDAGTRAATERRLRLSAPVDKGDDTWEYELGDTSSANIAALVGDAGVEDTHGIDRRSMSLSTDLQVQDPNVVPWFYYLTLLLPPAVLLVLAADAWQRRDPGRARMMHERERMAAAAVLAAVVQVFLLRYATDVAVADVSALTAVLGGWLVWRGVSGWRPLWWSVPRTACTVAVVAISAGYLTRANGGYALAASLRGDGPSIAAKLAAARRLRAPFADAVSQYVHACTRPDDRLLVAEKYAPNVFYGAGRGFAAARPYLLASLAPEPSMKAFSLARLEAQRVPIVLVYDDDRVYIEHTFPAIHHYIGQHYAEAGSIGRYRVLADTRLTPLHRVDDLPCFAAS